MYETDLLTLKEIAETYNVSASAIAKILKGQNINIKNGNNRVANRYVNSDYFNTDTEGAAYFYGLMLADGCMTGRGSRLSIELKASDRGILDTMRDELNITNPVATIINSKKNSSSLSFTVDGIYRSFVELSYTSQKSTKEVAPERFINSRHFWRGMIDGDGSISKIGCKGSKVYLCGSKKICEQFLSYCKSVNPSISTSVVLMKGSLYRVNITGIKAATILNELYSNAEFKLERKFTNAEGVINKYPEVRHVF